MILCPPQHVLIGIKQRSPLFQLQAMIPFKSAPIDFMHTFYLVLSKRLWNILCGEVHNIQEPWMFTSPVKKGITEAFEASKLLTPASFGRSARVITDTNIAAKAAEWKNAWTMYLPIILALNLPLHVYRGFQDFIYVCQVTNTACKIKVSEINKIEDSILRFTAFIDRYHFFFYYMERIKKD